MMHEEMMERMSAREYYTRMLIDTIKSEEAETLAQTPEDMLALFPVNG